MNSIKITIENNNQLFMVDIENGKDISIPISLENKQINAFNIPLPKLESLISKNFIGDTRKGGSCNCELLTFCPHGNGTHIECVGHISKERINIFEIIKNENLFIPCTLISVTPICISECNETYSTNYNLNDLVISKRQLERSLLLETSNIFLKALIIRTIPNSIEKKKENYSGKNPAYFTLEAIHFLKKLKINHLLIDLPSVDKEDSSGILPIHSLFWDFDQKNNKNLKETYSSNTITELCYIDNSIKDGNYLLNLQISPFIMHAVPVRPIIFPIKKIK